MIICKMVDKKGYKKGYVVVIYSSDFLEVEKKGFG